jgi:TLD
LSDDENLSSYFLGNTSKCILASTSIDRPTSWTDIVSPESLLNDSVRSTASSDQPDLEVVDDSWDLHSDTDEHPDAWDVLKDPNAIGYGANGTLPFRIFGTSADDESSKPHVLSPPLMESLQNFLPYGLSEQNFWMKYSLVRDGASMHSLLQHIRGAKYSIIALETSDGEVFGSFTSEVWRKNWNYFGTGESFLWRMRQRRTTECHSVEEQAQLESELDVYPWTGENNCVQLCTHDTIAVGGGAPTSEKKDETDAEDESQYGFGIAIDRLLLHGTSSHCATFGSPPLSKLHQDGSPFEIMNLEVWTLTPSYTLEDAEKLELGKLFLSGQ